MAHSEYIDNLKSVTEKLTKNYGGHEISSTLDLLMNRAMSSIILNTNFLDYYFLNIFTWLSQNHKRKISHLDRERVFTYLFMFMSSTDREEKCKIFRQLHLERTLGIYLIDQFLNITSGYQDDSVKCIKSNKARLRMYLLERGLSSNFKLYSAISNTRFWYSEFLKLRSQIVEKYYRFIVKEAWAYTQKNKSDKPLEDVVQNFLIGAYRAVDKYDPKKGALTSYISEWLRDAKMGRTFTHEFGIAYTLPNQVKVDRAQNVNSINNQSHDLDSDEVLELSTESVEDSFERNQNIDRIRRLCKVADPWGFARRELEIQEVLD